jgi:hypothetical protein
MPRNKVPLFCTVEPEERDRILTFAGKIGRPFSWVVRDACRVYLDAVEADPRKLLKPTVSAKDAGATPAGRTAGRPCARTRKAKTA